MVVTILGVMSSQSFAEELAGTSSRKAKLAAIESLPMQQLNHQTRQKISDVVNSASIYRRLPVSNIEVDPDHFVTGGKTFFFFFFF